MCAAGGDEAHNEYNQWKKFSPINKRLVNRLMREKGEPSCVAKPAPLV